jgi:hypothetical protein
VRPSSVVLLAAPLTSCQVGGGSRLPPGLGCGGALTRLKPPPPSTNPSPPPHTHAVCPPYELVDYEEIFDLLEATPLLHEVRS